MWVVQRCDDFPRKHKFSIADRWIDVCLDVQASLVEATYVHAQEARGAALTPDRMRQRARVACDSERLMAAPTPRSPL